MFEIGKNYDIKMLEADTELVTLPSRTVVDTDGPLIKINDAGKLLIINTHSTVFISAELN